VSNLFAELKRRNVFRVGLFYVVTAWLVIEVAETVLPLFDVPDGVLRGLVVLLVIGLVPALGLSWIYELTPEGIKRDAGPLAADAQSSDTGRKLNWATLIVAAMAIGLLVSDRLLREPASTDTAIAQQVAHLGPEAGALVQADTQAMRGRLSRTPPSPCCRLPTCRPRATSSTSPTASPRRSSTSCRGSKHSA
jgi:adenylate cyclase